MTISTQTLIANVAKQSIFAGKILAENGLLHCARNDGVVASVGISFFKIEVEAEVRKKFFFKKKNQKTFVFFPQQVVRAGQHI